MSEMNEQFVVVKNQEDQFSIWPLHKAIPAGWQAAGKQGNKEECLAFINAEWTDMRPRSLREQMEQQIAG